VTEQHDQVGTEWAEYWASWQEEQAAEWQAIADQQARRRQAWATPGVYVYSYPHYLAYPSDPESGRTLLKIGSATSSVISRIREQARSTAMPEDPVLLRIYEPGEYDERPRLPQEAEHLLHEKLLYHGHQKSSGELCGREWFLTDLTMIDKQAKKLRMPIRFRDNDGRALLSP
jgi:hypothetical protein